MACTNPLKEVRPQPLQSSAKQVSIEMDPMDPLNWNAEDLDLLGNVVELENDDATNVVDDNNNNNNNDRNPRKRVREDDEMEEHMQQQQQGEITSPSAVSLQDHEDIKLCDDLAIAADDRPRVSRRRKKKPNGFPKRPLGPYGIFYHRERQRIVESMTEGSLSEDDIQRQVGKLWRTLPDEDVKRYEEMAEADKARYHAEMTAYEQDKPASKKNHGRELDGEGQYCFDDLPPPPLGVTLIPASAGTDAGSVATAAGVKDGTTSDSPVPHTPPRWVFGPPLTRTRSYPSPVPCGSVHPPVQSRHYPYPPPRQDSYAAAVPPSPRSWPPPPTSPYQPPRTGSYDAPHFGHTARPASAYIPPPPKDPGYCIPPGMELALPTPSGGERKYKVSYQCYKMRAEDVQGFLESMRIHPGHHQHPHPPPPHHPHSYGHPQW